MSNLNSLAESFGQWLTTVAETTRDSFTEHTAQHTAATLFCDKARIMLDGLRTMAEFLPAFDAVIERHERGETPKQIAYALNLPQDFVERAIQNQTRVALALQPDSSEGQHATSEGFTFMIE